MLPLTEVCGGSLSPEEAARAPRLRLTHEQRARSRLAAMLADGTAVAVALPRGTVLRDGMVLVGHDGALAVVEAAPQPVLRVTTESPLALLRVVYHLANRHVPVQLAADAVSIEPDPVLERMLVALGAGVVHEQAPFEPESGAYLSRSGVHVHGCDAEDAAAGAVGEALSIEAHRRAADATPTLTQRFAPRPPPPDVGEGLLPSPASAGGGPGVRAK